MSSREHRSARPHAVRERRSGVLIADSDPLARRALREALDASPVLTVVAEAGSAAEAIARAEALRPDVVIVDPDLPDLDGITAGLRIRRANPAIRVVVVAAAPDDDLALLALRAGSAGIASKAMTDEALVRAVEGVAAGEAALPRAQALRLVERLLRIADGDARPPRGSLTTREREVLELLTEGRRTDEIAEELALSVETVRSHVKRVLAKLGVHTRSEAVAAAERLGRGGEPPAGAVPPVDESALRRAIERLDRRG